MLFFIRLNICFVTHTKKTTTTAKTTKKTRKKRKITAEKHRRKEVFTVLRLLADRTNRSENNAAIAKKKQTSKS